MSMPKHSSCLLGECSVSVVRQTERNDAVAQCGANERMTACGDYDRLPATGAAIRHWRGLRASIQSRLPEQLAI